MRGKAQDILITISAFGLLIMLAVSAVTIAGTYAFRTNKLTFAGDEHGYAEVVVQPGDTLWSIATSHVPSEDPRDVVGSMRELNELATADIFPGQVLTVRVTQPIQTYQLANGQVR